MKKITLLAFTLCLVAGSVAQNVKTLTYEGLKVSYPTTFELGKEYGNGMYQMSFQDEDGKSLLLFFNHDPKIATMSEQDLTNMCVFWVENTREQITELFYSVTGSIYDQYELKNVPFANRCMDYSALLYGLPISGKIYTLFIEDYMLLAYYWVLDKSDTKDIINILKSIEIRGKKLNSIY